MLRIFFLFSAILFSEISLGSIFFRPSFSIKKIEDEKYLSYYSGQKEIISGQTEFFDFSGGWIWPNGLLFSATVLRERSQEKVITVNSLTTSKVVVDTNIEKDALGFGVGWASPSNHGFYTVFTYFSQIEMSFDQSYRSLGIDLDYEPYINTGSGYQLEVGYKVSIQKLHLATHLAYKKFQYEKYTNGNIEGTDQEIHQNEVIPYLSVWFMM